MQHVGATWFCWKDGKSASLPLCFFVFSGGGGQGFFSFKKCFQKCQKLNWDLMICCFLWDFFSMRYIFITMGLVFFCEGWVFRNICYFPTPVALFCQEKKALPNKPLSFFGPWLLILIPKWRKPWKNCMEFRSIPIRSKKFRLWMDHFLIIFRYTPRRY